MTLPNFQGHSEAIWVKFQILFNLHWYWIDEKTHIIYERSPKILILVKLVSNEGSD